MIPNPTLRHHTSPVCHICIVSECQNAGVGDFGWQESLRPWSSGILGLPSLLAVPSKAVHEDNARLERAAVS
jgi:hypothetical protein